MKKVLTIVAALALICSSANAQGFLEKLGQRALDRAASRTESAADRAVDRAFDAVEGLFTNDDNNDNDPEDNQQSQQIQQSQQTARSGGWTCPECGATGNTGNFCESCGAKKPGSQAASAPASSAASAAASTPNASITTSKSDFVQGSVVLFEDNFTNERTGEFPSKWEIDYGDVQIAVVGDRIVPKFDGEAMIYPLIDKDPENYLPDVFTLEWDMYMARNCPGEIYGFNIFLDSPDARSTVTISYVPDGGSLVNWYCEKAGKRGVTEGSAVDSKTNIKAGGWNHFAISFNERAFKFYVNDVRVVNIPNMEAPKCFKFEYVNSHDYPYCCISNVRLGAGAVELYARNASDLTAVEKSMQETGKFVTNNILFETGKATLKPESMTDIQAVADYMKKNPSVRFEVQGHCDNQGSDKVNDPLSQQRAETIVAELVKLGVDEWNLRAVGKGSHEPVADNKTEEGRAKNRRVEFIKK
ncbi:MAG: OmpA family protein [Bacteroidia bacterium]|nr:OmpA family protein [Bacteroidia bacterium]